MEDKNLTTGGATDNNDSARTPFETGGGIGIVGMEAGSLQDESPDALAVSEPVVPIQPKENLRTRWLRRADVLLVGLLLLGGVVLVFATVSHRGKKQPESVSNQYATVQIPLSGFLANEHGINVGSSSVVINGSLKLNQGVIISPSVQPNSPVSGQLYFDQNTNQLAYYNGAQFVPLTANGKVVETIGGSSGNLTLGGGLTIVGNQLISSNNGVTSFGGLAGAIAVGSGLTMTGNTLQNGGVLSLTAGTPNLVINNDGNGNLTISNVGGGSGTVTSGGGTAGRLPVFTTSQNIEDSIVSQGSGAITVGGDATVTGNLSLGVALHVADGGTGANSFAANGVIVGNGVSPLSSVVAGASGLCFMSTAGAPAWGACPGGAGAAVTSLDGLTGALTIANSSGAGSTITIDDANTAGAKGLATFNATNFTAASGSINTVQNINTTADPTFRNLTLSTLSVSSSQAGATMLFVNNTNAAATGNLLDLQLNGSSKFSVQPNGNISVVGTVNGQTISGAANFTGTLGVTGAASLNGGASVTGTLTANTITPTAAMTIGSTGQTLTMQGSAATTLAAVNGASSTTISFQSPTANVTYRFLTTAAGTYDICTTAGNCTGVGGGVTTPGGTTNRLAKFTAGQTIGDSIITDNGTTVTIAGTLAVNTLTPTAALTVGATVQNLTLQGATTQLTATNSGTTNTLTFATPSGLAKTITLPNASGTVAVSASGPLALDGAGNLTCATCLTSAVTSLNGQTGAVSIANATASAGVVTIDDATTTTKGIASFNSTNFTVAAGAVNTVQNINSAASPTFAGVNTNAITPSGAFTLGATGQAFTLQGNASSTITVTGGGFTTTVGFTGAPTGAVTYNFDRAAAAGTYTVCSTAGNCAGVGGGVTTPGGTTNKLAKFTGAQAIGDSIITDNGTTVTIAGTLAVNTLTPTAALTVGATAQNLTLQGSVVNITATNGGTTNTLTFATPSGAAKTVTVPNASGTVAVSASGPLSLDANGNLTCATCVTSGGGGGGAAAVDSLDGLTGALTLANSTGSSTTITIDDASTTAKGIAQFNSTNFSVASGVVNTIQAINTTADPTFRNLTLSTLSVSSSQATNPMLLVNNTNAGGTGNLIDLQLNGASKFSVTPAGNTSAAGTLTVTGAASLNGGATVAGTLTVNTITPTGAMTVGATGQSFTLQGNASSTITATGGGFTTTVGFTGTPVGAVTYNFDRSVAAGTYQICTTVGNCAGTGSGVTTAGGTTNRLAKFTAGQAIGNSSIVDNGTSVTLDSNVDLLLQGATAYISNPQGFVDAEAFGLNATTNDRSVAVGKNAAANNSDSVAIGYNSSTLTGGTAVGAAASVTSTAGTAIGGGATAGFLATAVGNSANAAQESVVVGEAAVASAHNAVALGTGATVNQQYSIALGEFATTTASNQMVVGANGYAINNVVIGNGVTNAAPTGFTLQGTSGSGSDVAGANVTVAAGQGTGAANGGDIILQTSTPGTTGASLNSLSTIASFSFANGNVLNQNTTVNVTNTSGTQANGILFNRNGAGGTTTNGLNITNTAGTLTNGLAFTGTIGTDIYRSSGVLTIQGGGGVTLTSAATATANGTGGALTFNAGDESSSTCGTACAGGNVTIQGGNATGSSGVRNGGSLFIDAGTGATANGTINIGTLNSANVVIGKTTGGSTSILQAGGSVTLESGGASTTGVVHVGAGGAGSATPDFLGLDVKSTAGDPAGGTNGYMYYNASTNKFRCFENSAWTDCVASGGTGTGFIQNQFASAQTANFYIQGNGDHVVGKIQAAVGQTTDIFQVLNSGGTPLFQIDSDTNYATFTDNLIVTGQGLGGNLTVKSGQNGGGNNVVIDVQRSGGASVLRLTDDGLIVSGSSSVAGAGLSVADGLGNFGNFIPPANLGGNRNYTLPNSSGTVCLDSGNCGSSTGTLQTAYNFSTGGSTPEIKLDTTHVGVDIQDSDTGLSTAQNFISLRGSNSGGLGNILFGVGIQGNLFMKPSADHANLVEIQNNAGADLLNINSITKVSNINTNVVITGKGSGEALVVGGNSSAGNIFRANDGANDVLTVNSTGSVTFQNSANSVNAFNISASAGSGFGTLFQADTTNMRVGINTGGAPTLARSGLELTGALRLSGGTGSSNVLLDDYITPGGGTVKTKINIPNYDPGASGQLVALGLPLGADSTARAISLFDNRAGTHQQTLAVFSPDQNSIIGFSWDGQNSFGILKTNDVTGSSTGVKLVSGQTTGSAGTSGGVTLQSGDGVGTNSSSGSIVIDAGAKTGSGFNGNVTIGGTNAAVLQMGRTSSTNLTIDTIGQTVSLGVTGSNTATGTVNIASSTGGAQTVTVGSLVGASTTTIQGGTGNLKLLSGGNVVVGTSDTTGTLLVLDDKTSAGDPAGVNGAMYYNSNLGKFRCYQAGSWADCIAASGGFVSLQNAYTNSTGGSTSEIIEDSTRGAVDIQDRSTTNGGTLGANLLNIRGTAANDSTAGALLLGVDSSGNMQLGNNADKTIAVLQAASGNNGNVLTIQAGSGNGSNKNGGNLLLQGGNSTGIGTAGSVIVRPQTDVAGAFKVQNTAGTTAVLGVNTNTPAVIIQGTGTAGSGSSLQFGSDGNLSIGEASGDPDILTYDARVKHSFTIAGTEVASAAQNGLFTVTAVNGFGGLNVIDNTTHSILFASGAGDYVSVGYNGDNIGALLELDTKTGSGDPTGVNGGMYYNASAGKLRCYQNGAWTDCIGIQNGTSTQTGANFNIQSASSSSVGGVIQGAVSQTADLLDLRDSTGANVVRLDASGNQEALGYYNNAVGGIGQFGNLLTFSEQFDNAAWTKTSVTAPTADTIVAPDGNQTAESLADSASGGSVSQTSSTAPTNNNYTFSVWLKTAGGTQTVGLRIDGATTGTGTIQNVTATTTWQRFSVTQNTNGFTGNIKVLIFPGGTGGSGTVHAWGAQLVKAALPQVYARATSSTIAASAGVVSNGGMFISSINASDVPLIVQGAPSQSGDLLQLQTSAGTSVAKFSAAGVLTLAGNQTADITTAAAATATALVLQPGASSTGGGAGASIKGGDTSSTSGVTGGAVTIQGGSATGGSGTRNGGSVSIDVGTGATTNGSINIGTVNSAPGINVGKSTGTNAALAFYGTTTFKPTTGNDSTTAFRLQDAGGNTYFTGNSTNQRITVGVSAGTATGQLYVGGTFNTTALSSVSYAGDNANEIAAQGRYLYVKTDTTLKVVDASRPSSLATVGTLSSFGTSGGRIKVSGRYAYVLTGNNFYVVDISNPKSPSISSTTSVTSPVNLVVQGRYVIIGTSATNNPLLIYDVTNAAHPSLVSTTNMSFSPQDLTVQGRYVYYLTSANNMSIVDINNPSSLSVTGTVSSLTGLVQAIAVQGRYAYIVSNNGSISAVQSVDVSDPTTPVAVNSLGSTGGLDAAIAVQGRYAYIGAEAFFGSGDVGIIDISNPSSLSLVSSNLGPSVLGLVPVGRHLYTAEAHVTPNGSVDAYDLGGEYAQQFEAGGIEAGTLTVSQNATVNGETSLNGSLTVSRSSNFSGNIALGGYFLQQNTTDSATALLVKNALGTSSVFDVDTSNSRVGIGTNAPSRTLDVSVNNSTTTAPAIRLLQGGSGDATAELNNSAAGYFLGVDTSDSSLFKISSAVASGSASKFGYTTSAWNNAFDTGNSNMMSSTLVTSGGSAGTLNSISVYVGKLGGSGFMQVGVYTNKTTGCAAGHSNCPNTLVASSSTYTLTANSWNTIPITASISASTKYWLGFNVDNGGTTYALANTTGSDEAAYYDTTGAVTTFGTWPANWSGANYTTNSVQTNQAYRIYATYTTTSADTFAGNLFSLSSDGAAVFKNSTDSTQALQVANSAGNTVLSVDTLNNDSSTNLITDGGFEKGVSNWAIKDSGNTLQLRVDQHHSGHGSLYVEGGNAAGGGGVEYNVTLTDALQYSASFYIKNSTTDAPASTVEAGYNNGTTNTPCTQNTSNINSLGWTRIECAITTPASHSGTPHFYIKRTDQNIADMFIDDVFLSSDYTSFSIDSLRNGGIDIQGVVQSDMRLQGTVNSTTALTVQNQNANTILNVDTTDPNNLVLNPSFEKDLTSGLSIFDTWAVSAGGTTLSRDTSQAYVGTASLKIATNTTANAGATYLTKDVYPTQLATTTTYTLSWYAKLSSGSFTDIKAGYARDGATWIDCIPSNQVVVTGGWTRYSCSFTTIGTLPTAAAAIRIIQTSPTAHTFWIDAVRLEKGSVANAYGNGSISLDANITSPLSLRANSNSTTAFQIQDASGSNVLSVDSVNSNLSLFSGTFTSLGTWNTTSAINGASPAARYGGTSVVANGYLYILGGTSNSASTFANNVYYAKINANGTISSTWNTANTLPYSAYKATSVVANGYIYYMGGYDGTNSRSDIAYAKINSDGSLGSWQTANMSGPRSSAASVYLNGYVYVINGFNNSAFVGTTIYAKANADGSFGTWNTATGVLPASALLARSSAVAANGYIYLMGGSSDNTAANGKTAVYYAQPNATTGDIASNWSTSANSLPSAAGRTGGTALVSNGSVYYMGGINTSSAVQTSIYYSALPAGGGDLGAWNTSSSVLGAARWDAMSVIANGYMYEIGGNSSSATTTSVSTIYYTTTARLQVGGSIDLVGTQNATLADSGSDPSTGSTGGSITAGNGTFMGTLQVQGQANFAQSVSVNGNFSVGTIFAADTTLDRVTIGPSAGDTTGPILVLGRKTTSGDPAGVNGAMYYNNSLNKFRCYEFGFWRDCMESARTTYHFSTDFIGTTAEQNVGFYKDAIPSGSFSGGTVAGITGHPGISQLSTGTNAAGWAAVGANDTGQSFLLGNGDYWRWEAVMRISTASDVTNTFTVRAGMFDGNNSDGSDGCFLKYSNGVNGGKWQGVCINGGVSSVCDTGMSMTAGRWFRGTITVNSAGNAADFTVYDETSTTSSSCASSITTNIPTTTGHETSWNMTITKSLGTTARTVDLDYAEVMGQFGSQR